jgi:hypothetical protein
MSPLIKPSALQCPAANPLGNVVVVQNLKSFASVGGIYDIDDGTANSWWAQQFSTLVDPGTPATAVYAVVSF